MRELIKILAIITITVLCTLWFRGCYKENVKVEVSEVKGKFEPKKPKHVQIVTKFVRDTVIMYKKGQKVYVNNTIDKIITTDTLSKSINLNKFSTNFEDENVILNIEGIVQGEVKEITPAYTIKKKNVEVPIKQKETVFRVLAGGAVGLNKELNQAAYKLDLNFQNRKGDIISAEYLNVGGQQFGMVGFKKSIFKKTR